jgi:hypothetical protein
MAKKQTEILYLASPKHRGKKPERKRKNLIRLGKDQGKLMLGAEREWEDGQ